MSFFSQNVLNGPARFHHAPRTQFSSTGTPTVTTACEISFKIIYIKISFILPVDKAYPQL